MSNGVILKHYKMVAETQGLSGRSTIEDRVIREAEVEFLLKEVARYMREVNPNPRVLDAGCGNGYLLSVLRENFPTLELHGVEFTPELYDLAVSRELSNCTIIHGDIRDTDLYEEGFFDIIITERVMINLLCRKHQYVAVDNFQRMTKKMGRYIFSESFLEPLVQLNQARKEMCLDAIEESHQNKYISEQFVDRMDKRGWRELTGSLRANHLSTHFYVTRIVHKIMRPSGGKVKFARFSAFLSEALPDAIGNYSPILFRVFENTMKERVEEYHG